MYSRKKRPTLQDIADKVGTTKMTVSRYLRSPELVSNDLGIKIAKAKEDLGYVTNRAPDILSRAKSNAIGILVPSLTNQVFDQVIRGIEEVTEAAGYQTMLAHYGYNQATEESRIETLLSYNVDGIVLSESNHSEKAIKMIEATGVPVVEIMDSSSPALQQAVGIDNSLASQEITERFIKQGRTKLVYFAARMDDRTKQRMLGYELALKNAGLTPIVISSPSVSSYSLGAHFLNQSLELHPGFDGIICTNDDLAVGALFECQRLGINVPKDISIAGFHGLEISQVVTPRIASVITPRYSMGKIAAEQLISRIQKPEQPFEKVIDLDFDIAESESIAD